jgi:predicted transcriptional regulator
MIDEKPENFFIDNLQKLDLDEDEAIIYFALLKSGRSGTIARKLNENIFSIERTRIYSILKKLIEKGCVEKGPSSEDARKPKKFIAVEPKQYFELIMEKIQSKLDELVEFRGTILEDLNNIFENVKEILEDNLDPFITPYFTQLITREWKVIDQKINKGLNLLGGESMYEYRLTPPLEYQHFLKLMGLIACVYDTKVNLEPGVIKFVIGQIKNIIKDTHAPDFDKLIITEITSKLEGIDVFSLNIVGQEKKLKKTFEFGETLIIPIKNKIFFIWEEINHETETIQREKLRKVLNEFSRTFIEI